MSDDGVQAHQYNKQTVIAPSVTPPKAHDPLCPGRCKFSPLEVQGEALGIFCVQSSIEVRKNNLELVNKGTCHSRGVSVEGQTVILNLVCNNTNCLLLSSCVTNHIKKFAAFL